MYVHMYECMNVYMYVCMYLGCFIILLYVQLTQTRSSDVLGLVRLRFNMAKVLLSKWQGLVVGYQKVSQCSRVM